MVLGNSCGSTILSSKGVTIHRLRTTVLETGNWNSMKVSSLARKTRGAVTSLGLELRVWSHSPLPSFWYSSVSRQKQTSHKVDSDKIGWYHALNVNDAILCIFVSLAIILYLECFVMLKYPKEFSFVLVFKWEGLINWRTPVVKDSQLSRTLSAEALL